MFKGEPMTPYREHLEQEAEREIELQKLITKYHVYRDLLDKFQDSTTVNDEYLEFIDELKYFILSGGMPEPTTHIVEVNSIEEFIEAIENAIGERNE